MKARVIVCSDSAAAGTTEDTTGPVLVAGLRELGCEVEAPVVVPDDVEAITNAIQDCRGRRRRLHRRHRSGSARCHA
jgi:molybdopterin biosynthesis enzyme MoaB